jgi:inosine-uridine nucleoside N-ribohydrolase
MSLDLYYTSKMGCFALIFLSLSTFFAQTLFAKLNIPRQFDYIIDTDIGGDIDDVLALLVAIHSDRKPLAVTTNHIAPMEKAKITKLILTESGYPHIPVYAGIGVERSASEKDFLKLNPLWPPFYGYPKHKQGHKVWYKKQAQAYKQAYVFEFNQMSIEKESAPKFITKIAKNYSPEYPLVIVALGPLHNIDEALKLDNKIKDNILLVSMGGDYPKGYNWLISPESTSRVLSQLKILSISSELISENNLHISPEEFYEIENKVHSLLGKTIMTDWKNWSGIDKANPKYTQLADPVTVYLTLHPDEIDSISEKNIHFPCLDDKGALKSEFQGCWYSMPGLKNKLISIQDEKKSRINFVQSLVSAKDLKEKVINAIVKQLN